MTPIEQVSEVFLQSFDMKAGLKRHQLTVTYLFLIVTYLFLIETTNKARTYQKDLYFKKK